jgi:hypothetical protein
MSQKFLLLVGIKDYSVTTNFKQAFISRRLSKRSARVKKTLKNHPSQ